VTGLLAGLDGRGVRRVPGAVLCWPRKGDCSLGGGGRGPPPPRATKVPLPHVWHRP
jgi:hypothetical protein